MSMQDQLLLAEALRSYLVEHLPPELLPVSGGRFSLDGLLESGASMSLQITGGAPAKVFISGARTVQLPFTLFYRSQNAVNDNDAKSAMMGVLNGIGTWMQETPVPYLGDWLTVGKFEQTQFANSASQTEQHITYHAGYVIGYTTKGKRR